MMEKSGYIRKTGAVAFDTEGIPHSIIELHIRGGRYAIRVPDLARAIAGRVCVQVDVLSHNWRYYLDRVAGLAQVSASGKALNIDLFGAGDFTVSLRSLRAVIYGRERSAVIVKVPNRPFQDRSGNVTCGQQQLGAEA
jgi:ribosomal protein L25 (general stress protein Ctc)